MKTFICELDSKKRFILTHACKLESIKKHCRNLKSIVFRAISFFLCSKLILLCFSRKIRREHRKKSNLNSEQST